jgi:glycosyltransferase involved in cell wall biosynthesis
MGMQQREAQRLEGGRRTQGEALDRKPLVSIITVVFRDKKELENILTNLFEFDTSAFELIVIDGGSNDGTVELLQQWDDKIAYWLSEPDSGIYDAMNKGISAAHGEYILHLNAGDRLTHLPRVALAQCLTEGVDVASFPVLMDQGEMFRPKTGFRLRIDNTWHHQGTFYFRARHLGYNAQYRVFGDLDLNQRMLKNGRIVRLFDQVVSHHLNNGISMSRADFHEVYKSIRDNFGTPYVAVAFLWFKYKGMRQRGKRLATYLASGISKS